MHTMRKPGFTIVEGMIVLAVIGILLAIFIPNCMKAADGTAQPEPKRVQAPSYDPGVGDCQSVCDQLGLRFDGISVSYKGGSECSCKVIR